jgi:hypothetical protein
MCGIVGLSCFSAGGLFVRDLDIFKQALIGDSLRGTDGTGIVRVMRDGNYDLRKIEGDPFGLFRAQGVMPWLDNAAKDCDPIIFGHNRFATFGKRNTTNAHPFEHGDIVLVHNGFISNLEAFGKEAKSKEVDSHGLTVALASYDTLDVLEQLEGAYAIVWYDLKQKTLNIARNHDRPLWIAAQKQFNRMMFASEPKMMHWILDRNKETVPVFEELPAFTYLCIDLAGDVVKRVKYKSPLTRTYSYRGYGSAWEGYEDVVEDKSPVPKVEPTVNKEGDIREGWEFVNGVWRKMEEAPEPPAVPFKSKSNVTPISKPAAYTPPPAYLPPPSAPNYHAANQTKPVKTKAEMFPDSVTSPLSKTSFRVGEKLQWMPIDFYSTSKKQPQYCITGIPVLAESTWEVKGFTAGKERVASLMDADILEGTIRGIQRMPDNSGFSIMVTDVFIAVNNRDVEEVRRQAMH